MGENKISKTISLALALLIIFSGSAFIFAETVEGSVYSDNDDSDKPWEEDYDKYENYESCMNYRYQTDWGTTQCIIDYSDGTHGENDHDDWGNLNLGENL